jgi:signal transduction histidine kinase/CheY-like chemotaxis protein
MVVSSYLYVSDIKHKDLQRNVKDVISYTEANIKAILLEPETLLAGIAETIRGMILQEDDAEKIQEYVQYINNYVQKNEANRLSGVIGFYGLFEVYGKMFIAGEAECISLEDNELHDCPWYQAAVEAGGDIGITPPYIDAASGGGYMSFARRIFDEDGGPLGVVCLDINLDRIKKLAVDTQFAENGFGLLLNEDLEIIAHPDPLVLGMALHDVESGIAAFGKDVRQKGFVSERVAFDYRGIESIFFIERLQNGWYMGLVMPKDKYYQSTRNMAMVLAFLGLILSGTLIIILLRIFMEKSKADERVRIMFDTMPLGASYHGKNFRIFECNQETVNLFGLSNKQEYVDRFYGLSPERQPGGRLSRELIAEHIDKAFGEGHWRFEWMHQTLNGEPIPCEVRLVRVKHDDEFVIAAYVRDLRELKTTIAQMNESKRSLSTMEDILNGIGASVYVTIPDTCEILFINDYMKKLFKIESDCIGQFCYKLFVNADRKCDFCPCHKLDKEPGSTVVWERFNEITERVLHCIDRYIEWYDGRIVHIHHSFDVTELITAKEQAEQSNRFKTQFLSRMSHEVRTPMNAILGITEMQLQDEALLQGTREALDRINNSGYLLLGIINDILDLSKIEAGKLELSPTSYDVPSLISDTVHLIVVRYDSKPIEFKLQVDENIPSTLYGDELRIKQILNNLLSNAFKYTDEGEVVMSVTAEYAPQYAPQSAPHTAMQGEAAQVTLVFRVSDTGQGMTAQQVDKLFDEYTRFNAEANRATEGAGLGMNITMHLVRMMDGDISVESEPGKGSVFTVRLPQGLTGSGVLGWETAENLKRFHFGSPQVKKAPQIIREYMPYGRVLIVDDAETNLYVAGGLMAPYGLSIETALSGFEAINKVKGGATFDIIFMDHFMPKMDGMETTKIIREMGYTRPIIALTANALAGQAEMFMENGFDGFISKPIDIRQLNASLNKLIRDKYPPETVEIARRQADILAKSIAARQSSSDPELAAVFVRDAEKVLARLNMIHTNSYRRTDDIRMFVIDVHSMKSALANIGENGLSVAALKLEQAGRLEDINIMKAETPAFLEALRTVIEKNRAKEEDEKVAQDDFENVRAYLCEKLLAIQKACEGYDDISVNATLAELRQKKWPRPEKELLDSIADNLLHSDFEGAAKLAGDYVQH